ncbi:hypothetical protein [Sulfobacillus thermosulfidooxidans]|nr:hypothetical protein [Sulfobacillus thermosulfidooxidans]
MKPPQGLAGAHHIASAGRMSSSFADTRDCIAMIGNPRGAAPGDWPY